MYKSFVFLECVEKTHVGLKGLQVEFIVVRFVNKDDIQLQALCNLLHRLAGKDDFVQAVDETWDGFFLDASLRFRAGLVPRSESIAKVLTNLFTAHYIGAFHPFPFAVLAKKAIPLDSNRIDNVCNDH